MDNVRHIKIREVLDEVTDEREAITETGARLYAAVGDPAEVQELGEQHTIIIQNDAVFERGAEMQTHFSTPNLQNLEPIPQAQLNTAGLENLTEGRGKAAGQGGE